MSYENHQLSCHFYLLLSLLQVTVCGQNERYSPPLVLFQDFASGESGSRVATLLFKVDEASTSRSTFYAHYSFTRASDPDLGLRMRGAVRREYEDGEFREQEGEP